jgi:hypothetical protein
MRGKTAATGAASARTWLALIGVIAAIGLVGYFAFFNTGVGQPERGSEQPLPSASVMRTPGPGVGQPPIAASQPRASALVSSPAQTATPAAAPG